MGSDLWQKKGLRSDVDHCPRGPPWTGPVPRDSRVGHQHGTGHVSDRLLAPSAGAVVWAHLRSGDQGPGAITPCRCASAQSPSSLDGGSGDAATRCQAQLRAPGCLSPGSSPCCSHVPRSEELGVCHSWGSVYLKPKPLFLLFKWYEMFQKKG